MTIEDVSTGEVATARITDVQQANDRIIITPAPAFTVQAADKVRVYRDYHPTAALGDYDPPTRTELTSDVNSILDRVVAMAQLLGRSDANIVADRSSELALLNADEGTGPGDFDPETDATEQLQALITTIDTLVDAIKAKTDDLTFTVAGSVDSNVKNVAGGSALTGSGTGGQGYGES